MVFILTVDNLVLATLLVVVGEQENGDIIRCSGRIRQDKVTIASAQLLRSSQKYM